MTKAFFALPLALFLISCSSGQRAAVAVVGNQAITLEEFEELYAKNNGGWEKAAASTQEERERFLDLLVKFRLKVQEAKDRGLLQDTSLINELETYRLSIATSYMLDKELVEPRVRELYNRRVEEVRASHILFRVEENASPTDTLAAYEKAMRVIGLLDKIAFDSLAVAYSEDPSASFNRGDLGYFTAGRLVVEFEDAAYALKVGEYTKRPIRTQYGYHIINVTDRRPAKGQIRLSHILRLFTVGDENEREALKDSMWAMYRQIKDGLPFEEATARYSDDQRSAPNGGDIGYYTRDRLPPDLAETLYSTPVGEITEPIMLDYGYHIFKVVEILPPPPFEQLERDLRQLYQQLRYPTEYENYLHNLKKQYGFQYNVEVVHAFTHAFDSTHTPSSEGWKDKLPPAMLERTLFSFGDNHYRVSDVASILETSEEFISTFLLPNNVEKTLDRIVEMKILELHAQDVPKRHPAMAKLMQEYRDGVLLFRIEQDEIWNKVAVSDSLLRAYYAENKERYRWPDRINIQEILVPTDSVAQVAYKNVLAGADFGDVAAEYTMRPTMKEKRGVWGLLPVADRDLTQAGWTMAVDSIRPPFHANEGWVVLKVLEKDSARVKTFEECHPELTSDYREYASKRREAEWLEELTRKHGVTLYRQRLADAFKRKRDAGAP